LHEEASVLERTAQNLLVEPLHHHWMQQLDQHWKEESLTLQFGHSKVVGTALGQEVWEQVTQHHPP
jgi:hypothetical protein